jgi:hypothetical protein
LPIPFHTIRPSPTPNFFDAFWPNFFATMLGVLLGGLITLLVNRLMITWAAKSERQNEIARFDTAMGILIDSLAFNKTKLGDLRKHLAICEPLIMELDTHTWDLVKLDIIHHLHLPKLQIKIEFHYSKLASVARLRDIINEIYYNYPCDSVAGPPIKVRTLNELIERKIIELNDEIDYFLEELQQTEIVNLRKGKNDEY